MYQIIAERGPGSRLGPAVSRLKANGQVLEYQTREEAQAVCDSLHARISSGNLHYTPVPV